MPKQAAQCTSSESRDEVQAGDTNTSVIRIEVIFQDMRRSGLIYAVSTDRGVFNSLVVSVPLCYVL